MSTIRKGSRPKKCVMSSETPSETPTEAASQVTVPDVAPVRRRRPTKISVSEDHQSNVLMEPNQSKEAAATEPIAIHTPVKALKAPKATNSITKAKLSKSEDAIPLLHKEITLPTHQEMDMESYSADGFHIEYVSITLFRHEDRQYYRDSRKNKLYQYLGPGRVGTYVGRYFPGQERVVTDVPDSDEEA